MHYSIIFGSCVKHKFKEVLLPYLRAWRSASICICISLSCWGVPLMFRRLCTPDKCDSNSTTDYKHAANTVNMTNILLWFITNRQKTLLPCPWRIHNVKLGCIAHKWNSRECNKRKWWRLLILSFNERATPKCEFGAIHRPYRRS